MKKPLISIIAALDEKRGIGLKWTMPWIIHEDLKNFKRLTEGHAVIMGRKTFESIRKLLSNRTNIVITGDKNFIAGGCTVAHSIEEALVKAEEVEKEEIFIIGGGSIYAQTINIVDKLYLTIVEGNFKSDTFFPEYWSFTNVISKKDGFEGTFCYTFLELEKK